MRRALWLLLGAALISCGGDDSLKTTDPDPGPLEIRLSGPTGAGAVLLLVEGGPIDAVVPTTYFTASTAFSGVAWRVLVAGDTLRGVLARVMVQDRRLPWKATIVQVADGATFQLRDSTVYALTVRKP